MKKLVRIPRPSIGLLVHFETREIGGYFKEILAGVLSALEGTGCDLKLIAAPRFRRIEPLFAKHAVDGILIPTTYQPIFPSLDRESRSHGPGWPVVGLNDCTKRLGIAQFGADSYAAMKELTEILVRRGCRHFFFLGRERGLSPDADARFQGFLECLKIYGIAFSPVRNFADGYFSESKGYAQAIQFLRHRPAEKAAIVCANDAMALGALKAVRQLNLRCPEEVALTGFDGLPETESSNPPIATVRVPLQRIAQKATAYLLSQIWAQKDGWQRNLQFRCRPAVPAHGRWGGWQRNLRFRCRLAVPAHGRWGRERSNPAAKKFFPHGILIRPSI